MVGSSNGLPPFIASSRSIMFRLMAQPTPADGTEAPSAGSDAGRRAREGGPQARHVRRAEAVGRAAEGRGARAGPCRSRPGPRLCPRGRAGLAFGRSEEHTSELQSLMRSSYAVFCLKKKTERKKRTGGVRVVAYRPTITQA